MSRQAFVGIIMSASLFLAAHAAVAIDKAADITRDAQAALESLYAIVP